MTRAHHLLGGTLHKPPYPKAVCHCLLLEDRDGLVLIDSGIGLLDVRHPLERLGQPLIDLAGFQFHEPHTVVRQVEALGFQADDVSHVVLTHADPDHTGGLADFPRAAVHLSREELEGLTRGQHRYVRAHFDHGPRWNTHPAASTRDWFGLAARPVPLGLSSEVLLVPLFGHTLGHCGVAIEQDGRWLLHVGDAYYLRAELATDDHPVSELAAQRAEDDAQRRASLEHLRRLARDHADRIDLLGYHDPDEFPHGP